MEGGTAWTSGTAADKVLKHRPEIKYKPDKKSGDKGEKNMPERTRKRGKGLRESSEGSGRCQSEGVCVRA
jgi:hypothetical protein